MKKIILIMALLLIAAPAMATVTVTCAKTGLYEVTVSYTATGNDVRAFAFDVNAVGANITSITKLPVGAGVGYFVHPGSTRLKDPGATIQVAGTINCAATFPGTLPGLGTPGVTTEQASLYTGGTNSANSPGGAGVGSSGDLFKIVVSGACTVQVRENAIRGGVVMDNPDENPALVNAGGVLCSTVIPVPCWGDVGLSDSTYGHDGVVDAGDLLALMNELGTNGTGDNFTLAAPGQFYPLGDVGNSDSTYGQDGIIDAGDLLALMNELGTNGTGDNFTLPGCFPLP